VKEALKTVSKYLSLQHTLIYDIMYILYTVGSKIQMLSDHDGKIIHGDILISQDIHLSVGIP